MNVSLSRNAPRTNHRTAQIRQQSAWSSADYAVVGNALQIVGEELCETMNLCQDARVLDVARWVRDAGFTAYMPSLFGRDGAVPLAE